MIPGTGLRRPGIRGNGLTRHRFSPARHELTHERRRVSSGESAQHIGKRLERYVRRKIDSSQSSCDDEP